VASGLLHQHPEEPERPDHRAHQHEFGSEVAVGTQPSTSKPRAYAGLLRRHVDDSPFADAGGSQTILQRPADGQDIGSHEIHKPYCRFEVRHLPAPFLRLSGRVVPSTLPKLFSHSAFWRTFLPTTFTGRTEMLRLSAKRTNSLDEPSAPPDLFARTFWSPALELERGICDTTAAHVGLAGPMLPQPSPIANDSAQTRQRVWRIIAITLCLLTQLVTVDGAGARPGDGQLAYARYCGACHGAQGDGDGPARAAFRNPPADLTALTRKRGSFPRGDLLNIIDQTRAIAAHGSRDLPIWGETFWRPAGEVDIDLSPHSRTMEEIVDFVEGLQPGLETPTP
jgi:hypothetical protein